MTLLNYYKTYFSIISQPVHSASGTELQNFLTSYATNIIANDPAFSTNGATSISYIAYSGNIDNSPSSTQKWVKSNIPGLFNANIQIALILYKNDGINEEILLRVSNSSIKTTFGYPGITSGGGGGSGSGGGSMGGGQGQL